MEQPFHSASHVESLEIHEMCDVSYNSDNMVSSTPMDCENIGGTSTINENFSDDDISDQNIDATNKNDYLVQIVPTD